MAILILMREEMLKQATKIQAEMDVVTLMMKTAMNNTIRIVME